jgi:hypothetical protein
MNTHRKPSGATARGLAAVAIFGIALVMAGCSVSVGSGTKTVDKPDEVSYAQKYLSDQLSGLPPPQSVDCPSDVEAKVDTTFECQATLTNGQEVTLPCITSVNGDHAELHVNPDLVNQALAVEVLYKTADSPTKSVQCPTDVPATVGKTFDCQGTSKAGPTSTVTLKVEKATSSDQSLRVVNATTTGELSKQTVEQQSSRGLAKSVGQAPASVSCPAGLEFKKGASERCTLTANNGDTLGMTVTVTSVTPGGHYEIHVTVAKR